MRDMSRTDTHDSRAARTPKPIGWLERLGRNAAYRLVTGLVRDYEWVHLGIGILGNFTFFIGSIFFLWKTLQVYGTWLFIIGAGGMFIGSLGSAIVKLERRRLRPRDENESRA